MVRLLIMIGVTVGTYSFVVLFLIRTFQMSYQFVNLRFVNFELTPTFPILGLGQSWYVSTETEGASNPIALDSNSPVSSHLLVG